MRRPVVEVVCDSCSHVSDRTYPVHGPAEHLIAGCPHDLCTDCSRRIREGDWMCHACRMDEAKKFGITREYLESLPPIYVAILQCFINKHKLVGGNSLYAESLYHGLGKFVSDTAIRAAIQEMSNAEVVTYRTTDTLCTLRLAGEVLVQELAKHPTLGIPTAYGVPTFPPLPKKPCPAPTATTTPGLNHSPDTAIVTGVIASPPSGS
jgi:hypothetical protein